MKYILTKATVDLPKPDGDRDGPRAMSWRERLALTALFCIAVFISIVAAVLVAPVVVYKLARQHFS